MQGGRLIPVGRGVVVDVQLASSRHLSCQGLYSEYTEEQQLCGSHRWGRRGTDLVGAGAVLAFFFVAIAYTRTPDDLDDRNYDRKVHCNGTPVFDGLIAHRCDKVQSCYRCPSPFAAVAVGIGADAAVAVAPFVASFYPLS